MHRMDDEAIDSLKRRSVEDGMQEKIRAFRELSRRLREQAPDFPQTPSIHPDQGRPRISGHRSA